MADTMVLTEDQIERLLQEAETRLSAKDNGQDGDGKSLTIPSKMEMVAKEADTTSTTSIIATAAAKTVTKSKSEQLSVRVPQPRLSKKEFAQQADASAGPSWFSMPKTNLTPELKRDLQLLRMRNVLDSKRHYKKDSSKLVVPKFSQVGTLVAGPTEYFSARMTKKERKRTLLEEVMETEDTTRKFKSKYGEIQAAKTSGKKGDYKKMMKQRYGSKR